MKTFEILANTTLATGSALWINAYTVVHAQDSSAKRPVGYLYTTTNGEGLNEVVRLARYDDGTVGDEKTYPTYFVVALTTLRRRLAITTRRAKRK